MRSAVLRVCATGLIRFASAGGYNQDFPDFCNVIRTLIRRLRVGPIRQHRVIKIGATTKPDDRAKVSNVGPESSSKAHAKQSGWDEAHVVLAFPNIVVPLEVSTTKACKSSQH